MLAPAVSLRLALVGSGWLWLAVAGSGSLFLLQEIISLDLENMNNFSEATTTKHRPWLRLAQVLARAGPCWLTQVGLGWL